VIVDPATGQTSVIDWGAAMWGPLLYDVASAYWFSVVEPGLDAPAFDPFVTAYRDAGVIGDHEWRSLPAFVRLRAAVQAFYFAWRCDNDVLVGHSREQNQAKLGDARRFLESAVGWGLNPIG
jgi:Ser/Thr protein kinase RdoA (MazF antagonist)